jgi:hypothetical protein
MALQRRDLTIPVVPGWGVGNFCHYYHFRLSAAVWSSGCTVSTWGPLTEGKSDQSLKLIIHFHLLTRLKLFPRTHIPSWRGVMASNQIYTSDKCSAGQETSVFYVTRRSMVTRPRPQNPVTSQMKPVHILTLDFFKTHFNIILPSTSRFLKWFLSSL